MLGGGFTYTLHTWLFRALSMTFWRNQNHSKNEHAKEVIPLDCSSACLLNWEMCNALNAAKSYRVSERKSKYRPEIAWTCLCGPHTRGMHEWIHLVPMFELLKRFSHQRAQQSHENRCPSPANVIRRHMSPWDSAMWCTKSHPSFRTNSHATK